MDKVIDSVGKTTQAIHEMKALWTNSRVITTMTTQRQSYVAKPQGVASVYRPQQQ